MVTFVVLVQYLMLLNKEDSVCKLLKDFTTLRVNKASLRKDKLAWWKMKNDD